jgi:TPR repeat protein
MRLAAAKDASQVKPLLAEFFDQGLDSNLDPSDAANIYREAADLGHCRSQYHYGIALRDGHGVKRNPESALKYLKLAADQESAEAYTALGLMYHRGDGIPKNYAEAMKWLRLAAAKQEVQAIAVLAGMCKDSDPAESARLYKEAANLCDSQSQYLYGLALRDGRGVAKDPEEAMVYLKLAAGANPKAYTAIGEMYRDGIGIPQDRTIAYTWFELAARRRDPAAIADLTSVKSYKPSPDVDNPHALYTLGLMYNNGLGFRQYRRAAQMLLRKAAQLGNAEAAALLKE